MLVLVSGRLLGSWFIAALELRSELLDAAGGVDEALLAGVGGMRVAGDVARYHEIFGPVDGLFTGGLHGGLGEETLAGADIDKADVVESGMAFGFHGKIVGWWLSPDALCSGARPC